ncbi:MAG TPA: type II toxin-antitoxin system Phd/YefM family antitoxin [Stellaceae bacterium]|nr:type II toxin-antitoxin system Phd/YefM family antitoxin [Stellaceae bacterium]
MTETVNVTAVKTHLSRLLDRVAAGEEIVIARAGKPIAKLVPLRATEPRRLGLLSHIRPPPDSFFFDPLPEEELRLWEGDSPNDPETPHDQSEAIK